MQVQIPVPSSTRTRQRIEGVACFFHQDNAMIFHQFIEIKLLICTDAKCAIEVWPNLRG